MHGPPPIGKRSVFHRVVQCGVVAVLVAVPWLALGRPTLFSVEQSSSQPGLQRWQDGVQRGRLSGARPLESAQRLRVQRCAEDEDADAGAPRVLYEGGETVIGWYPPNVFDAKTYQDLVDRYPAYCKWILSSSGSSVTTMYTMHFAYWLKRTIEKYDLDLGWEVHCAPDQRKRMKAWLRRRLAAEERKKLAESEAEES